MLSIFQHFVLFNNFQLFNIFLIFNLVNVLFQAYPFCYFSTFSSFRVTFAITWSSIALLSVIFSKVIGIFSILRRGFFLFETFIAIRIRMLMYLYIPTGPDDLSARGIFHARRLIFHISTLRWLLIRD